MISTSSCGSPDDFGLDHRQAPWSNLGRDLTVLQGDCLHRPVAEQWAGRLVWPRSADRLPTPSLRRPAPRWLSCREFWPSVDLRGGLLKPRRAARQWARSRCHPTVQPTGQYDGSDPSCGSEPSCSVHGPWCVSHQRIADCCLPLAAGDRVALSDCCGAGVGASVAVNGVGAAIGRQ